MKWERLKNQHEFEGERMLCEMEDICAYDSLPCEIPYIYFLNGVRFDKEDFGESRSESDGNYGCSNAYFEPIYEEEKMNNTLGKYHICKTEYDEIATFLENLLYVGMCGWCV